MNSFASRALTAFGVLSLAAAPVVAVSGSASAATDAATTATFTIPDTSETSPALVFGNYDDSLDFGMNFEQGTTLAAGKYLVSYLPIYGAKVEFTCDLAVNGKTETVAARSGIASFDVDQDIDITDEKSRIDCAAVPADVSDAEPGEELPSQGRIVFGDASRTFAYGDVYAFFGDAEDTYDFEPEITQAQVEAAEWVPMTEEGVAPISLLTTTDGEGVLYYDGLADGETYTLRVAVTDTDGGSQERIGTFVADGDGGAVEIGSLAPEGAEPGTYTLRYFITAGAEDLEIVRSNAIDFTVAEDGTVTPATPGPEAPSTVSPSTTEPVEPTPTSTSTSTAPSSTSTSTTASPSETSTSSTSTATSTSPSSTSTSTTPSETSTSSSTSTTTSPSETSTTNPVPTLTVAPVPVPVSTTVTSTTTPRTSTSTATVTRSATATDTATRTVTSTSRGPGATATTAPVLPYYPTATSSDDYMTYGDSATGYSAATTAVATSTSRSAVKSTTYSNGDTGLHYYDSTLAKTGSDTSTAALAASGLALAGGLSLAGVGIARRRNTHVRAH